MSSSSINAPFQIDTTRVRSRYPLGRIANPTVRNRNIFNDTNEHGIFNQKIIDNLNLDSVGHVNINNTDYGYTPLTLAIDYNNQKAIIFLLSVKNIDINKTDENGFTPLTLSIRQVQNYGTGVLKTLLENSTHLQLDFEKKDGNGRSIIDYINAISDNIQRFRVLRIIVTNIKQRIINTERNIRIPETVLSKISSFSVVPINIELPIQENIEGLKRIYKLLLKKKQDLLLILQENERRIDEMLNNNIKDSTLSSSSSSSSSMTNDDDDEEWEDITFPNNNTTLSPSSNVPLNSNTGLPSSTVTPDNSMGISSQSNVSSSTSLSSKASEKRKYDEEDEEDPNKKRKPEGGRKKRTTRKLRKSKKNGSTKVLRHKTRRML